VTDPVVGIDLGTTNSVVAVSDGNDVRVLPTEDGFPLIPSVVSFHPNGDILVGRSARERRLIDARNTVYSVKRLIGRPFRSEEVRRAMERFPFRLEAGPTGGVLVGVRNETYTLSEISAFVLREVRRVAQHNLALPCSRAIVTVPANFNELQRNATKAAGRVAGLEVLRILNEPTAAALAYGYGRGSKERVAVFDLGGGTFDITILDLSGDVFEVLATAGDTFLGGDDIDALVADQMAAAFLEHHRYDAKQDPQAFERLRAAAEWAKCQLSSQEEVRLRVEELAYGDGGAALDLAFGLTRQMLESMMMPLVARCFDVCEDAMRAAGIRPIQLDNVILVGGSTRIPLVKRMVADYFQRAPLDNVDPDLVVAKGAAIQGFALTAPAERQTLARVSLKRITQTDLQRVKTDVHDEKTARGRSLDAYEIEVDTQVTGSPISSIPPDPVVRPGPPPLAARKPPPPPPPRAPLGGRTMPLTALVPPTAEELEPATTPGVSLSSLGVEGRQPVPTQRGVPEAPFAGKPSSMPPPPAAPPPPFSPSVAAVPPPVPVGALVAPPPGSERPRLGDSWQPGPVDLPALPPVHVPPSAPIPRTIIVEPEITAPLAPPPLLLDVTPHSLGVETVGGYCEQVIRRNASIPVEQTRIFTTAKDNQDSVRVRICQGESRRLEDNQGLGEVELMGLRRATRGVVKIGVTFELTADGTLNVRAKDLGTGREQSTRVHLVGGLSEDDIRAMQARQQQMVQRSASMPR
jgi:molecular chaperone DnaK